MKDKNGFREGPFYCSNCNEVLDDAFGSYLHPKCGSCGQFIPEIPKNVAQEIKLINLQREYPSLPIVPIVHSEVCGDSTAYWRGSLGKVEKGFYLKTDNGFLSDMDGIEKHIEFLKDSSFTDLMDSVDSRNSICVLSRNIPIFLHEEEIRKVEIDKVGIKEVIYVTIEYPEAI